MTTATLPRTTPAPPAAPDAELDAAALVREIEQYLAARGRATAHPLVTATTEELVRQALAELDAPAPESTGTGPALPGGMWRMLPDRLLSLHPARRATGVERARISVAEHLELTALVLQRWGWAQTGGRIRTMGGRRCILGAQRVLYALGYGTEDTAIAAGAHLNAALRARGVRQSYPVWNEHSDVDREQVLALVRDAAAAARR
ncbi:DUF6197 family protein [Actinacidiphila acididurans]|uniref:Uncharacterized protein n=1 Tax=Actinacidiphila acididurans TaxID=2784346 RepID=A0ABS2TNA0_9ACTN|nr:hypothetical protein [Actinacidiphila acididurans]MBM9504824.1 hypothetical protein [Actinacidiphila acididurans]